MYGAIVISRDADFLKHTKRFIGNINKDIAIICVDDPDKLSEVLSSVDHVDVIVCDHNPPEMDAIAVFNERNRVNDLRPFIIITKNSDGNVAIKAFELRMDYYMSRDRVSDFYINLASKIVLCAERRKQELDRALNERRMRALVNMANMHNYPFEEILNYALESSVSLTSSQMGYVATFEHDTRKLKMMAWSQAGLDMCKMKNRPIYYDLDTTGVWGEPIRQRRSVIINDYKNDSDYVKKGIPTGHVRLQRMMMIPIIQDGIVVATAGVANKPEGYTEDDEMQFILLMDGMMSIYKERMLENESIRRGRGLEGFLKHAPIGVILLDNDVFIVECNVFAEKLIKSYNMCLSETPFGDQTNKVLKFVISEASKVKDDQRTSSSEYIVDHKGSRTILKFLSSVTKNKDGENTGFMVIIDDITENVNAVRNKPDAHRIAE